LVDLVEAEQLKRTQYQRRSRLLARRYKAKIF
jgi:hypothetical protein